MPVIDTPAEGFPLPAMTPPTRTLRDVAARLTPGGRARAMQRAEITASVGVPDALMGEPGPTRNSHLDDLVRSGYMSKRAAYVPDLFDRETGIGYHFPNGCTLTNDADGISTATALPPSVLTGEIDRRLERLPFLAPESAQVTTGQVVEYMRTIQREQRQADRAFADGRAYERGAALRRNVGAKSLGSRRVQAQGVAADYLRDDPQDGARHAALVLAGFMGQDPETVR